MTRPLKFPLKYEKGIRYVAPKGTTNEAEKPFREMLAFRIGHLQMAKRGKADEKLVQKKVEEIIDDLKENGFDQPFFEMCCHDYAAMPRRALRKKVKKEFDANQIPKVTKTPLDEKTSALFATVKYLHKQEKSSSDALKVPKTD
jgi:hypothetical protein